MDLIQPFINAADAVLAQHLACTTRVADVSMERDAYQRHGTAAVVEITGDIEGRIVFDVTPETAMAVASRLAGETLEPSEEIVSETVYELSNLVIGNAVTVLNDQGFQFKVHPPALHMSEEGLRGTEEVEALVMDFSTPVGSLYMNIAMRYNRRRRADSASA